MFVAVCCSMKAQSREAVGRVGVEDIVRKNSEVTETA
jgi:hypothetical protein